MPDEPCWTGTWRMHGPAFRRGNLVANMVAEPLQLLEHANRRHEIPWTGRWEILWFDHRIRRESCVSNTSSVDLV